jgi:exodeoxyribonuclease V alpha subunit
MDDRRFFERARPFVDAGLLADADVHTVALVAPRYGEHDVERMLGLAFAARAPRVGHAGVRLEALPDLLDAERDARHAERQQRAAPARHVNDLAMSDADEPNAAEDDASPDPLPWPADKNAWAAHVLTSPLVGEPSDAQTPFVRQPIATGALLLSRRMYSEQVRLAEAIRGRLTSTALSPPIPAGFDATLARLFPDRDGEESRAAVEVAAKHALALVVGGPGTGKTFSVSRLLAALLAPTGTEASRPHVALAAPTGKAAARMREALRESVDPKKKNKLELDAATRDAILALPAETLHRLLGVRPDGSCRHDKNNPLAADLVIVDEVSMVDLTLMRRLVEAVRTDARLVLLGDRDQLASVEAGSVLADLVEAAAHPPLKAHLRQFKTSRRFASAPDIGLVAACLQSYVTGHPDVVARAPSEAQRTALALGVLCEREGAHATDETHHAATAKDAPTEGTDATKPAHYRATRRVEHLGPPERPTRGAARPSDAQIARLVAPYLEGFDALAPVDEPASKTKNVPRIGYAALVKQHCGGRKEPADDVLRAILDAFDRYRVLAVHRAGPLGVAGLERALAAKVRDYLNVKGSGAYWIGKPILITQNAYDVGLMNGDVGIILPRGEGSAAVFPGEAPGTVRSVATARLPPHEGALAMTVHKSQGSQFERVALVLAGRSSPIQTRELVYTGVTRAKNQLAWLGDASELKDALDRRVTRESGLVPLLTQTTP